MIWDGSTPSVRIKAWKDTPGQELLADVDNITVGGEVTVDGYAPKDGNDVIWEVFVAGTDTKLGESVYHMSCSDDDMDGAEDCGKRQGNGKSNDGGFINDWILDGMIDAVGTLDCSPPDGAIQASGTGGFTQASPTGPDRVDPGDTIKTVYLPLVVNQ